MFWSSELSWREPLGARRQPTAGGAHLRRPAPASAAGRCPASRSSRIDGESGQELVGHAVAELRGPARPGRYWSGCRTRSRCWKADSRRAGGRGWWCWCVAPQDASLGVDLVVGQPRSGRAGRSASSACRRDSSPGCRQLRRPAVANPGHPVPPGCPRTGWRRPGEAGASDVAGVVAGEVEAGRERRVPALDVRGREEVQAVADDRPAERARRTAHRQTGKVGSSRNPAMPLSWK